MLDLHITRERAQRRIAVVVEHVVLHGPRRPLEKLDLVRRAVVGRDCRARAPNALHVVEPLPVRLALRLRVTVCVRVERERVPLKRKSEGPVQLRVGVDGAQRRVGARRDVGAVGAKEKTFEASSP